MEAEDHVLSSSEEGDVLIVEMMRRGEWDFLRGLLEKWRTPSTTTGGVAAPSKINVVETALYDDAVPFDVMKLLIQRRPEDAARIVARHETGNDNRETDDRIKRIKKENAEGTTLLLIGIKLGRDPEVLLAIHQTSPKLSMNASALDLLVDQLSVKHHHHEGASTSQQMQVDASTALRKEQHDTALALLARGLCESFPDALRLPEDKRGWSLQWLPLHNAVAKARDDVVVRELLRAYPEACRKADAYGCLPLHVACRDNPRPSIVRALLETCPEAAATFTTKPVNAPRSLSSASIGYVIPLHFVSALPAADCHGGSSYPFSSDPENSELAAPETGGPKALMPPLLVTADEVVETVREMLRVHPEGARVGSKRDDKYGGDLPLHTCLWASADSRVFAELLRVYPEGGCAVENYGHTPLHEVCKAVYPNLTAVRELIRRHPETARQGNAKGTYPVHMAAYDNVSRVWPILPHLVRAAPEGLAMPNPDPDSDSHTVLRRVYYEYRGVASRKRIGWEEQLRLVQEEEKEQGVRYGDENDTLDSFLHVEGVSERDVDRRRYELLRERFLHKVFVFVMRSYPGSLHSRRNLQRWCLWGVILPSRHFDTSSDDDDAAPVTPELRRRVRAVLTLAYPDGVHRVDEATRSVVGGPGGRCALHVAAAHLAIPIVLEEIQDMGLSCGVCADVGGGDSLAPPATVADAEGNLPLHIVCGLTRDAVVGSFSDWDVGSHWMVTVTTLIRMHGAALGQTNNSGLLPFHVAALESDICDVTGLYKLLREDPMVVMVRVRKSG